jgi:hypothetical protein
MFDHLPFGFARSTRVAGTRPVAIELCDSVDCIVRYSPNDKFFATVPRGIARFGLPADVGQSLPEPDGTSGGGLWQYEDREAVWSPCRLQLIAIQSSWTSGREHLRSTQIHCWLELVQGKYRELDGEIAKRLEFIAWADRR